MHKAYLTCAALLILMSVYKTVDGVRWRDGQKWRQRRIAHVFGKRNGDGSSNALHLPVDQSAQFPILNEDSEDYDSTYITEPDHIPQSIINRLSFLEFLQRFRPTNDELLNYWDNVKSYMDYSEEH